MHYSCYSRWREGERPISLIDLSNPYAGQVINHVINAAILVFVLSAANSDLYIAY